jgi:Flp pilus assembly protein TadG
MMPDRGSLTVFFALLVTGLLLVAGLVLDGGRLLAARRDVVDAAQSAARAGAQQIDPVAAHTGITTLAPDAARAAAEAWLADVGHRGDVTATDDTVTVAVSRDVPLALLGLAGIPSRTVYATETARIVEGVTEADS